LIQPRTTLNLNGTFQEWAKETTWVITIWKIKINGDVQSATLRFQPHCRAKALQAVSTDTNAIKFFVALENSLREVLGGGGMARAFQKHVMPVVQNAT
jgi:hypothetical protein